MNKSKKWYQNLWIWSILYFSLGFFNILFAWLGMIEFPCTVEMGLYAGTTSRKFKLGGTIQLWILQSHAHFNAHRSDCDGSLQTTKLVHFLSDGMYDSGNL